MAAKLRCFHCKAMLKEEGDQGKDASGEYRVYDSLWNSKYDARKFRVVECLECNQFFNIRLIQRP